MRCNVFPDKRPPGRIKHGLREAVDLKVGSSRKSSQGAYVALPVMNQQGQGPRTFMGIQGANFEGKHAPRSTHGGTRTRNLLLRREAPYPLGHTSAELMQSKAPFGGRERSEEAWGGSVEGVLPMRIELTTLGLRPTRANCAIEAGANTCKRRSWF